MPNQNECDHEIGMEADCETWEMRDVETIKTSTVTKWFIKQESSDTLSPNFDEQVKQFNYCSDCGAKIDWDKIKEDLDGK